VLDLKEIPFGNQNHVEGKKEDVYPAILKALYP